MRIVKKTLGIYIAFLLQSLFLENMNIFSCSPDLLMTAVIIMAVTEDFVPAASLGAFAGLLVDVMYGKVFGINILLFMYISLFVSLAADKKNSNSPLIMSWVCFVSIAAVEIVRAVFRATMGKTVSVGLVCSNIFVKGFFAALFALLFVLFIQLMEKRKAEKKSLKNLSQEEVAE